MRRPRGSRRRRRAWRCTRRRLGSKAPEFTFPACVQTIAGPSTLGSLSARIRPWLSAGTWTTRSRPRPSIPSALNRVAWASSPTTTVTFRRAMKPPCRSTSWSVCQQHRASCRRERGEVCHRRPGDERHARVARQVERVQDPSLGNPLDRGSDRRADLAERILVPRRGKPAGGQRRRQGSAGDEAEVARTGARHHALHADLVQSNEDLGRRDSLDRQRPAKHFVQLAGATLGFDSTLGERFDEPRRALERLVQQFPRVAHGLPVFPLRPALRPATDSSSSQWRGTPAVAQTARLDAPPDHRHANGTSRPADSA